MSINNTLPSLIFVKDSSNVNFCTHLGEGALKTMSLSFQIDPKWSEFIIAFSTNGHKKKKLSGAIFSWRVEAIGITVYRSLLRKRAGKMPTRLFNENVAIILRNRQFTETYVVYSSQPVHTRIQWLPSYTRSLTAAISMNKLSYLFVSLFPFFILGSMSVPWSSAWSVGSCRNLLMSPH